MSRPPTTITLVRHGESGWNRSGQVQGQSFDAPGLTELGYRQALEAAASLDGIGADRLLVSDLTRAQQTADPIAATLGLSKSTEVRLRERALGDTEGTRSSSGLYLVGIEGSRVVAPDARPTGGESVRDLYQRVAGLFDELASGPDRSIVCVTHGGVVRVAVAYVAGITADKMAWGEVDNASVWKLVID